MTTYNPPKKNTEYICYVGLRDQADTKLLKANPTLATGDVKVSSDGGAFGNIGTIPAATPALGTAIKVTVSAAEMNADNVVIALIDAAGAEWCDLLINLQTSVNHFDDLSTFDITSDTVDVGKISGDSTAADNAELFFDGTGYAGTNNVIPTVTTITGLNDPTAAAISDAVWDEATSGHTGAGTTGKALTDASVAGASAADTADAVWDEAKSGHTTSGSFGEEIQSHATSSEVTVATVAANALASTGTVSIHRGDTWRETISDLGDLTDRSKLWLTIKTSKSDADAVSLVQIEESADLLYIDGGAAGTSTNGTLTVDDATDGDITLYLDEVETAKLDSADGLFYDVQMLDSSDVTTLSYGTATVDADVTLAVT